MFERFTARARRVLVLAQDEACELGHSFIGTEHILLGLLHEGEDVAAKALEALGVEIEDMRHRIGHIVGPAASEPVESPPFTPRAKKVLELSLREALQLGHNYIGTEHLLLALGREGHGVAAQVLVAGGVTLTDVRRRVLQLLSGYAGGATPEQARPRQEPLEEVVQTIASPPRIHPEPRCQYCREAMATHARSRVLLVPDDAGGPPVGTTVVYCSGCGRGIVAYVDAAPRPDVPDPPA